MKCPHCGFEVIERKGKVLCAFCNIIIESCCEGSAPCPPKRRELPETNLEALKSNATSILRSFRSNMSRFDKESK